MIKLEFRLPDYMQGIEIKSKPSKELIDTEKSAEEFYEVLREGLPSGMYSQIEEKVVENFLKKNCSEEALDEMIKLEFRLLDYMKGINFYRILKRISGIIK